MENYSDQFSNRLPPEPARPAFLKVICIISFINCGVWILIFLIGSLTLAINEDAASAVLDKVLETNPALQIDNPAEFFHEVGKLSFMCLIANIVSLLGVIMMWRLNKTGFFIYAAAELIANFLGMGVNLGDGDKSIGGTIFLIILDLVFIVLYAVNLKYMNRNKAAQI